MTGHFANYMLMFILFRIGVCFYDRLYLYLFIFIQIMRKDRRCCVVINALSFVVRINEIVDKGISKQVVFVIFT